ncbi:MAG: hypothetical protein J6570_04030 [Snodgrassella sp.]|nr:hypothetical protein [Snodgrassella sp.]
MSDMTNGIKVKVVKPTQDEVQNLNGVSEDCPPDKSNEIKSTEGDVQKRKLNEEIENLKADRALRDKYSFKAFKVVKKSLWGWAILLFIYSLIKFLTRHENGGFEIFSDHVLIAITTATTLNIYAGFLSLIRGLFPSIKIKKIKKK